jgi:hypothetical protein
MAAASECLTGLAAIQRCKYLLSTSVFIVVEVARLKIDAKRSRETKHLPHFQYITPCGERYGRA